MAKEASAVRFKATILLSLVLIALGGYLYFVEIPGEKKNKRRKSKKSAFTVFLKPPLPT